jgi:hypothetical protein
MSGWCGRGRGDPALYPICHFQATARRHLAGRGLGGNLFPPHQSLFGGAPALAALPLLGRRVGLPALVATFELADHVLHRDPCRLGLGLGLRRRRRRRRGHWLGRLGRRRRRLLDWRWRWTGAEEEPRTDGPEDEPSGQSSEQSPGRNHLSRMPDIPIRAKRDVWRLMRGKQVSPQPPSAE